MKPKPTPIAEGKNDTIQVDPALVPEAANDGYWLWDIPSGRLTCGARAAAILGYGLTEMVAGQSGLEQSVHPDDRDGVKAILAAIRRGDRALFELEHRLRHRDGRWVWVLHRGKVTECDAAGRAVRVAGTLTDITARKQTEDALRESNDRYDELVRRIPLGVYTMRRRADGAAGFERASERFCQMLGLDEKDVLRDAESVHGCIHPDDRASLDEAERRAAQTLAPLRWEGRCVAGGEARWLRIESAPTVLPDGDSMWNGVISDITARRQAEEALRASEDQFRSVFLNAPVGIFHSVWEGRMLAANPALAKLLGYSSPDELVAATSDMTTQIYVDPEIRPQIIGDLRRADGWVHYDGVLWRRKDGRIITVDVTGRKVLDENGSFAYLEGFIQDITERKQTEEELLKSEEKYRFITENVGDVVWTLDPETLRFTSVSPSVRGLRGFTPEEVMAEPMDAALTAEDSRQARAVLAQRVGELRAGKVMPELVEVRELEQPCKDGSWVWTEVTTTIRLNEKTGRPEVLGLTRDITTRRAAEGALKRLADRDPLTGILNQRAFHAAATQRIAALGGAHAALIFMDLDGFKEINDRYGHATGDRALATFAQVLGDAFRESDIVGRVGGDEFAVLAVSREVVSDEALMARLRAELRQVGVSGELPCEIAASSGVAWWDASMGTADFPELIGVADARMYEAKRAKKAAAAKGRQTG